MEKVWKYQLIYNWIAFSCIVALGARQYDLVLQRHEDLKLMKELKEKIGIICPVEDQK